jgi:F-type H+-transporting ATPase subunit b
MATESDGYGGEAIRFAPFDQVDTFASQIFWLALTFGALYFALSRYLLPRLATIVEGRDATIAANVAAAARASEQADEAVRRFETRLAEARGRARDTAAKAKSEAEAAAARETARMEAELEGQLAAAETRIRGVRSAAMANVAGVAAEAAQAIAERLGGVQVDPAAAQRAVAAAVEAR